MHDNFSPYQYRLYGVLVNHNIIMIKPFDGMITPNRYIRTEMITEPIYRKQKRHQRRTNLLEVEKKSVAFRRHWGDSASGITTCTRRAASTEPLAVAEPQHEPILHSSRARVKENPNHWHSSILNQVCKTPRKREMKR